MNTNLNDDHPTPYITESFPPYIKRVIHGIKSRARNLTINLSLTPFFSRARLYP